MLKGDLPWTQVEASTVSEAYEAVGQMKKTMKKELLEGLPEIFSKMVGFVRDMKFKDQPEYAVFRKMMTDLMKKNGYDMDYKYDWEYL